MSAVVAIRMLCALVFFRAGVGKMRHWAVFEAVLANYRVLPPWLVRPVAYALPPGEVVLSGMLLCGWLPTVARAAGAAAAALFVIFGWAIALNLLRGRSHIDCGCFQSHLKQRLAWPLVLRNGLLAALLAAAAAVPWAQPDAVAMTTGAFAGVAAYLVLESLNTLWAVGRPRRPGLAR